MRSSDGRHWIALDHIRAVAALMVFSWHFLHMGTGHPIPFGYAPAALPLAFLDEGHIGVALFMTLSGYLFAKLLDGKDVLYGRFFWNRFIRLAPLLVFTFIAVAITQSIQFPTFSIVKYAHDLADGLIFRTWPNGGWSITVEMHFYVLLPAILILTRHLPWTPLALLVASIGLRAALFLHYGTVQDLGYYTIVGRIDQFLLGIVAFQCRGFVSGRHGLAATAALAFMCFYWWLDHAGGYMALGGKYPSPSALWIILPTIEGAAFAWMIAYYDSSFTPSTDGISRLIGRIGTYSYSIYLLHPFFVFRLPLFINHRFFALSNFYVACAASVVCFCGMAVIGWASYTMIEKPFLKYRVRYTRQSADAFSEMAAA